MSPPVGKIQVTSWEQARRISRALYGWAFRGQPDASFDLSSTLERAATRNNMPLSWLTYYEKEILHEFQRRAHQYIQNAPPLESTIEWLALMQHHGAPTRLLDFTYSFYVAAFFACEFAVGDTAIWAVNCSALDDAQRKLGGDDDVGFKSTIKLCEQALIGTRTKAFVVQVRPSALNQRLSLQQGTFLFPMSTNQSFTYNLSRTIGAHIPSIRRPESINIAMNASYSQIEKELATYKLIKFVFPRDRRIRVQNDLMRMNISATTLFPGLDGFSRSLHSLIGWYSHYEKGEDR